MANRLAAVQNFTFDSSLLPVPAAETASFCGKLDNTPLDDFANDLRKFTWLGVGVIAIVALLLSSAIALREFWSWRTMKRHLQRVREALLTQEQHRLLRAQQAAPLSPAHVAQASSEVKHWLYDDSSLYNMVQLVEHPLVANIAFWVTRRLGLKNKRTTDGLRWYMSWLTHPAALAALTVGIVGLLTTEMQLVALRAVEGHYSSQLGTSFDSMLADTIGDANATMWQDSIRFANGSNAIILKSQNDLNGGLFQWVIVTTSTMNDTLNEFTDALAEVMNVSLVHHHRDNPFTDTSHRSPLTVYFRRHTTPRADAELHHLHHRAQSRWHRKRAYMDPPQRSRDIPLAR